MSFMPRGCTDTRVQIWGAVNVSCDKGIDFAIKSGSIPVLVLLMSHVKPALETLGVGGLCFLVLGGDKGMSSIRTDCVLHHCLCSLIF